MRRDLPVAGAGRPAPQRTAGGGTRRLARPERVAPGSRRSGDERAGARHIGLDQPRNHRDRYHGSGGQGRLGRWSFEERGARRAPRGGRRLGAGRRLRAGWWFAVGNGRWRVEPLGSAAAQAQPAGPEAAWPPRPSAAGRLKLTPEPGERMGPGSPRRPTCQATAWGPIPAGVSDTPPGGPLAGPRVVRAEVWNRLLRLWRLLGVRPRPAGRPGRALVARSRPTGRA